MTSLAAIEPDWEFGIKTDGHQDIGNRSETLMLGTDGFEYSAPRVNWGDLLEG